MGSASAGARGLVEDDPLGRGRVEHRVGVEAQRRTAQHARVRAAALVPRRVREVALRDGTRPLDLWVRGCASEGGAGRPGGRGVEARAVYLDQRAADRVRARRAAGRGAGGRGGGPGGEDLQAAFELRGELEERAGRGGERVILREFGSFWGRIRVAVGGRGA